MRPNLRVKRNHLVSVDISASQPTFLCVLAEEVRSGRIRGTVSGKREETGKITPLSCTFLEDGSLLNRLERHVRCESWERLQNDIESGGLYERIREAISKSEDGKEITLANAKREALMAMFIQANRNTAGVKALRRLYRGPYHFLREMKRPAGTKPSQYNNWDVGDAKAHCKASHCLQWIESTFVFDTIIARIMNERPDMFAATIHDAIVVEPENAAYVQGLIEDAFREKGIAVKLKIEDLSC